MNVYLNGAGQIDCGGIDEHTTVQDLLDAVDAFLAEHPLPCGDCADSCCKKPWAVEVDSVAARRIAGAEICSYVQDKMTLKWNYALDFRQYVLKKHGECPFVTADNLCTIYDRRPVICRLYVCTPKSALYDRLRELIAATCLQALVYEQNMRQRELSARTIKKHRRNPALGAVDYSMRLQDIAEYGLQMGWIDELDSISPNRTAQISSRSHPHPPSCR